MKKVIVFMLSALLLVTVTGCNSRTQETANDSSQNKEVTLTWYVPNGSNPGDKEVFTAASAYAKEKLNANLDIISIDGASYNQKMQVVCAGKEDFDIAFTSDWLFNYYTNVVNGAFVELDELLPKYAPKLYASIDERCWDGTRIDGKIYGVINQQVLAHAPTLVIPEKNVKATGIDINTIHTIEDIEPYLKALSNTAQKKIPNYGSGTLWNNYKQAAGLETLAGTDLTPAIYYNNSEIKVINQFETPEFKSFISLQGRLVSNGVIDEVIIPAGEETDRKVANEIANEAVSLSYPYTVFLTNTPQIQHIFREKFGGEIETKVLTQPYISTPSIVATLNAVSSTSKKPERAMMLLELVNTDKYLYNLLVHGIEGVHYEKVGENKYRASKDNPYFVSDWVMGSVFNGFLEEKEADDVWVKSQEINKGAKFSPVLGFSAKLDSVDLQCANVRSVCEEYLPILYAGTKDYENVYNNFIQSLKAAGSDKIIEEVQRQYDEGKVLY